MKKYTYQKAFEIQKGIESLQLSLKDLKKLSQKLKPDETISIESFSGDLAFTDPEISKKILNSSVTMVENEIKKLQLKFDEL